jgi:DNA polymerase-3 subunit alpha (Gram-positive type)
MEKSFFEVFPKLKVKKELEELLATVVVTKVASNPAKTHLRVYIKSDRWIHKKYIFELENQIEKQCFAGLLMNVTVIERFCLSRQYNPANFLETYRSSMELELRNYNMLECNLFKRSKITFPEENVLHMVLPDSVIARQKSEILVEYLHKVFCERCGMDLKAELEFVETEESRYRKNAAIQIRQEVENVIKNAKHSEEEAALSKAKGEDKKGVSKKASASSDTKQADKKQETRETRTFEKKGKMGRPRQLPKGFQSGCYLRKRFRWGADFSGEYHRSNGRGYHPWTGYGGGGKRNPK